MSSCVRGWRRSGCSTASELKQGTHLRDLFGKVAFVTGGASGIGNSMARAFLHAGMTVVVADIRQAHLDRCAAELASEKNVHFIRLDVSDRAAMAEAADETERVFGKIHLLCNNAGVGDGVAIDNAGYDDWDWVLKINLGGVINGIVTFVPRIKAHGEGGHIVNTASMHSFVALPAWGGIYTTSKFAVRGLSESLRLALAPFNIGVSLICPGLVNTNIGDSFRSRPTSHSPQPAASQPPHPTAQVTPPPAGSGMDPAEVAERTLEAIRHNDFYVLTHLENKEELRGLFEEVLAAFPRSQDMDPGRKAFEDERRQKTAAARALMPRH
jgi:NAD(P)-dependent dehydrogenase (short-subunit alcohol dehydrogenase family)